MRRWRSWTIASGRITSIGWRRSQGAGRRSSPDESDLDWDHGDRPPPPQPSPASQGRELFRFAGKGPLPLRREGALPLRREERLPLRRGTPAIALLLLPPLAGEGWDGG